MFVIRHQCDAQLCRFNDHVLVGNVVFLYYLVNGRKLGYFLIILFANLLCHNAHETLKKNNHYNIKSTEI